MFTPIAIFFTAAILAKKLATAETAVMQINVLFYSDQTRCASCTYLLAGDDLPL